MKKRNTRRGFTQIFNYAFHKKGCHSRMSLSGIYNACRYHQKEQALLNMCTEDPRVLRKAKSGMTPLCNNGGFTLIELLVVVLIIGILAAVALPQYKKAVVKSRVATILPVMKSIVQAQEVYYLANGQFATDLSDLDVDIPSICTRADQTSVQDLTYTCGPDFYLFWDHNMNAASTSYCPAHNLSYTDCTDYREFQFVLGSSKSTASGVWARPYIFRCISRNSSSFGEAMCKTLGKPVEENGKIDYEF